MMTTLSVLTPSGDQELTWNHDDPTQVQNARAAVAAMRLLGYSFFLQDGTEAQDEVAAGQGSLSVRRVSAEELLAPETPEPLNDDPHIATQMAAQAVYEADQPAEAEPAVKPRRGRPRKIRQAVAVPRMQGG